MRDNTAGGINSDAIAAILEKVAQEKSSGILFSLAEIAPNWADRVSSPEENTPPSSPKNSRSM